MRGVVFVADLEQYHVLTKEQQKVARVRVTFFGEQAQTLINLTAAQVVAAEKDLWQVLFFELTCGQNSFLVGQISLFYVGFVVSGI